MARSRTQAYPETHHYGAIAVLRSLRHRPQLLPPIQGKGDRRAPGRTRAWRALHSAGKHSPRGRPRPSLGARHRHPDCPPSLGRALRPADRGCLCGPGRGGPHHRRDPGRPCEQGRNRAHAQQAAGHLAGDDYYLRAVDAHASFFSSYKAAELYEVRRLLEQSVAIDPNYARAYARLSWTHLQAWIIPLDGDHLNLAALDRAYQLACKAVQLDPNLPQAHAHLGHVLGRKREHDAAVATFEKAMLLNPNFTDWRFGEVLVWAGDPLFTQDLCQHVAVVPNSRGKCLSQQPQHSLFQYRSAQVERRAQSSTFA